MGSEVAKVLLQCVYEGCIPAYDGVKERRPYHRNCKCALHKAKDGKSNKCTHQNNNISYPVKTSWKECRLSSGANNQLQYHQYCISSPLHTPE
ncbi:hypothetical protein IFM89_005270 [Coptis chinensis]|uniref:Uncharacterized protein n=1 Tax=Coptis chinensis TaxID=261450 RepID=A0A835I2M4_9MAGN|nr:hypothetical protein IFM89_020680 [Coptis chinensis]KAF9623763.1 hypothetical protein IFM89_005270 [Coptis chinensis]